jgi:hypothetical protein
VVQAGGSVVAQAAGSAAVQAVGSVVEQGAVQELVMAQAQVSGLKPERELKWVVMWAPTQALPSAMLPAQVPERAPAQVLASAEERARAPE